MSKHTAIGIDLAKRTMQVCVVDIQGFKLRENKAIKRADFLNYMRQKKPAQVYMEACSGAHYWARQLRRMGHTVLLIAPQFVVPFRKGHKTDRNDALAIVEAGLRPDMRFVAAKNLEQQQLQTLHRVRDQQVKQRTQLINQLHGMLLEYGIESRKGQKALCRTLSEALEDGENELTPLVRELFDEQRQELKRLNVRISDLDRRVQALSRQMEPCNELLALRGVGPVVATLLYVTLGEGGAFRRGKDAAAFVGLTPRQYSTGGKVVLIGIGKTGQPQLRAALIRGAHAAIKTLGKKDDPLSRWLRELVARAGTNKAAVALANKNVRMAWAMLSRGESYDCPGDALAQAA